MKKGHYALGIVTIVLGGLGFLGSLIPIVNNISFVFGIIALILGIITLIISKKAKGKITLGLIGTILSVVTIILVLVSQSFYSKSIENATKDASETSSISSNGVKKADATSSKKDSKKESSLELLNKLAANGKSTGDLMVTGTITVGKSSEVVPGIYDLEILGGSGNITGERKNVDSLFINYLGAVSGSENGYPSKIRIILFDGDTLKLDSISKIKLTAVSKNTTAGDQLGQGEWVVGRDIKAGTYKLSTNGVLNEEYDNLGWTISQYDDTTGDSRNVQLNPSSKDVVMELKDGQVLSTSYDNTSDTVNADSVKLIFTTQK